MLSRPRTCHVEQPPLCFINVVEFGFIGGVAHPLVEWKHAFIASHNDDRPKFEALGKAHRCRCHLIVTGKPVDRSARAFYQCRRAHEDTDFVGLDVAIQPTFEDCTHRRLFLLQRCKKANFRFGTFEYRDDSASFVLGAIDVTQHRR